MLRIDTGTELSIGQKEKGVYICSKILKSEKNLLFHS